MATIQSLGLHEPSALPYLIAEGILPNDPPASSYHWHLESTGEGPHGSVIEEEVLFTRQCVVWSRSGVIKRVYNLNVEGEAISHAFTTCFRSTQIKEAPSSRAFVGKGDSNHDALTDRQADNHAGVPHVSPNSTTLHDHESSSPHQEDSPASERALVVILRTQVHIFLVSGDTHVVPMSFEVDAAFAAPVGFLIQRKLSEDEARLRDIRSPGDGTLAGQADGEADRPSPYPILQKWLQVPKTVEHMPRIFSFTEIFSELGLVVCQTSKPRHTLSHRKDSGAPLDPDEELLYISHHDELQSGMEPSRDPLYIALTMNTKTHKYTLWHVRYAVDDVDQSSRRRKKPKQHLQIGKRKSSNVLGRTSTGTPMHRGHATSRESFSALAQTFSENVPRAGGTEVALSQTTELAHDLGADFTEVGVQTRSARRVSSMLARTDLSKVHDRTTFNDLATGHPGRKSLNRNSKRGESVGSFGDRQSFGGRRRSSFPVNESLASNGTSFLDGHGGRFFDELDPYGDIQSSGAIGVNDAVSELPREVHFYKLKSLSRTTTRSERVSPQDQRPKVFSLRSPNGAGSVEDKAQALSICIMDRESYELTIVNIVVQGDTSRDGSSSQAPRRSSSARQVRATDLRRGTNIVDACKVVDGTTSRILLITRTMDGIGALHLEAPWSSPIRVELPPRLPVFDPLGLTAMSPDRRRDTGLNRMLEGVHDSITRLESVATNGQFYAIDEKSKRHCLQLQLEARDPRVGELLNVAQLVLPGPKDEGLLVAWWEVVRWLATVDQVEDVELTALVVVLFSMAVPFIDGRPSAVPRTPSRKKGGALRSSSGPAVDFNNWSLMMECELAKSGHGWSTSESWRWTSTGINADVEGGRRTFLSRCISYARDFLQTPAGELAIGPEGYLPTAMNKERTLRSTSLAAILVGLHLYREEQKLHSRSDAPRSALFELGAVLAQFGQWLRWEDWTAANGKYYSVDVADIGSRSVQASVITSLSTPGQPFEPPSIFAHIEHCVSTSESAPFPTLLDVMGRTANSVTGDESYELVRSVTPRTFAILEFLRALQKGSRPSGPVALLEAMVQCGIDGRMLETLPDGVAVGLHRAIVTQRHQPLSSSLQTLLRLVDRDNMSIAPFSAGRSRNARPHLGSSHEASRDYHSIGNLAFETDNMHSWDASSEADRQGVTRLIFREDRRFQEASKLVNQTRPPLVECHVEPEWTEAELLEAQKDLVHYVARRTLSVASGRGMMHFNARVPLLTERAPIPAFSLQCVMKARHSNGDAAPMTFSADKAAFTEDKVCWAFFHNGSSAGLMISKDAKGIDTSWILYNKPPELTNRHAGFLLALGLNGHLKNLAKWVAFKYLTPKHTMTSVGLLLGLSASYLGTMDTLITRLLSVHVTRLLPPGAAELNLSPLTQTTGIMGIGLLYCNSQHRRMSEVMLSEIENNDPEEGAAEDAILRDEGYRLAAGFALGMINLGQGKRLHSLHDMAVLERLLTVAIGTKNVNLVHVLDRATAGATVAVALIYLKTNDKTVAEKIDIPDTLHQFDYVRPDIFLLRTVARHLIMWEQIRPDFDFVVSSLPDAYQHRASLRGTRYLSTDDLPFFNIVAGICLAVGLKYAGSADESARDLLVAYLDQFIRLTRLPALNYDAKLTRNHVRNCQDVLALSVSAVMAGTGDLLVLRRLRSLHGRTDADTFYGSHLAAHMAIGALFLGGGTHTFGTSNLAVASLLCAYYPLFPTSVLDNKSHLQAFRHLWALAAEARCLVPRDVDSGRPVSIQLQIHMKDGSTREVIAPSLLPELDQIRAIQTTASEYWDVTMDFADPRTVPNFRKCPSVYLRKRAAYDAPASNLFASELQALAEAGPAPSVNTNAAVSQGIWKEGQNRNPFEWIFGLDSLTNCDVAEKALVLPRQDSFGLDADGEKLLKGTVVDTRLELEHGILDENGSGTGMSRDQLWQLKLLFTWYDRWDQEKQEEGEDNEKGTWLRREVIDRLRWRVWKMAHAEMDLEA